MTATFPNAWKLAAPTSAGATGITLDSPLLPGMAQSGLLLLDPYSSMFELARVKSKAGTSVTLTAALKNPHPAATNVMWLDGGLIPWTWAGAQAASTSAAAGNVAAYNGLMAQLLALAAAGGEGAGGVEFPPGQWYVNNQLKPERELTSKGYGPTNTAIVATVDFPFDTTGEVAVFHPQNNGVPVGFAAESGTTRAFMEGFRVDGALRTNAQAILSKLQQPGWMKNIRVDNCPGLYGICLMGQDAKLENIEILGCQVPLYLRAAELVEVDRLNIEQTTGPVNVLVENAKWVDFKKTHFEPSKETTGFSCTLGATDLHWDDFYYANPQVGDGILFDCPQSNPTGAANFIIENYRANANSLTFNMVRDVQRKKALTSWNTDTNRWIGYLDPRLLLSWPGPQPGPQ